MSDGKDSKTQKDWTEGLRGAFLVIDGPDGAGKSTQARRLGELLAARGVTVCPVRDPGGTAIGEKIRAILLDRAHERMSVACELMLYMASRAQLAAEVIRPAIQRGECVLADRYISSTVAYQGAGGIDVDSVMAAGQIAVEHTWPDLTIVLDLPAEEGLARVEKARGGHDRMEAKGAEFHRRVRELFLAQADRYPGRFVVVDARGSEEQVHERLVAAVRRRIAAAH